MSNDLVGSYVIVAPDAIPAHSGSTVLQAGEVGRVVLVESGMDAPPILWVVCRDMRFRLVSIVRAKLLSDQEASELGVQF